MDNNSSEHRKIINLDELPPPDTSIEKLLQQLDYSKDIEGFSEEISRISKLYDVLEKHVYELMGAMSIDDSGKDGRPRRQGTQSKPRVSHVYVSSQVSNLMSLISTKLGMRTSLVKLKESEMEKRLKLINAINKADGEGNDDYAAAARLINTLFSKARNDGFTNSHLVSFSNEDEEDIDAAIDARLSEENLDAIIDSQTRPKQELETNPEQLIKNKYAKDDNDGDSDEEEDDTPEFQDMSLKMIQIKDDYRLVFDEEFGRYYLTDGELTVLKELERDIDFTVNNRTKISPETGLVLENLSDILANEEEE